MSHSRASEAAENVAARIRLTIRPLTYYREPPLACLYEREADDTHAVAAIPLYSRSIRRACWRNTPSRGMSFSCPPPPTSSSSFSPAYKIKPITIVPTLGIQMIALSSSTLELRYHVARMNWCSTRWNATRRGQLKPRTRL